MPRWDSRASLGFEDIVDKVAKRKRKNMVHFVGAGSGAVDLITVRGQMLLKRAQVILYAGSLVNPELLANAQPECEIYNTAYMTLEEVLEVIQRADCEKKEIVRLHTGDGAIYGAIREQIQELEQLGIAYDICPGVSSFLGAAASLGIEYTLPGVSQSVIITRAEGRTAVPEKESLKSYAAHQTTLVLFLSSGLARKVQEDLLEGGYEADTPVAVVYKATWPEEQIVRTTLGQLPQEMENAGITKTALIIVGRVLDAPFERSKLYDPGFTTEYRKGQIQSEANAETSGDARIEGMRLQANAGTSGDARIEEMRLQANAETSGDAKFKEIEKNGAGVKLEDFTGRIALFACSKRAYEKAQQISQQLKVSFPRVTPEIYVKTESLPELSIKVGLKEKVEELFPECEMLLFICATGIAVRCIASSLQHKGKDPAVLVMDEMGQNCISLLSGHMGGANAWVRELSRLSGANPVITTATDCEDKFSVDVFARRHGLKIEDWEGAKEISRRILDGEKITVRSELPLALSEEEKRQMGQQVSVEKLPQEIWICAKRPPKEIGLHLIAPSILVGIGCRKGIDCETMEAVLRKVLDRHAIPVQAVKGFVTLDRKAKEPGLLALAGKMDVPIQSFTPEQLNAIPGKFSASDFVKETTGVDNVCERSVVAAGGELLSEKYAQDGVTIALGRYYSPEIMPDNSEEKLPEDLLKNHEGKLLENLLKNHEDKLLENVPEKQQDFAKLYVVGIGPGAREKMTLEAKTILEQVEVIAGYKTYVDLIRQDYPEKTYIVNGMLGERERCQMAIEAVREGKSTALICSGDSGVYGMASLLLELNGNCESSEACENRDACENREKVEVVVVPGITAALSGGAVLGAPLSHDFAIISLSDLLTPWEMIASRLSHCAQADLAMALYNPASHQRPEHLKKACEIILQYQPEHLVCAYVQNIGREGERYTILTLGELKDTPVDMFTTVFIGNSKTRRQGKYMITPRIPSSRGKKF